MDYTTAPREAYSLSDIEQWADDLRRIRGTAQRKRLLGYPDVALEAGCFVLERRLAEMRRGVQR
jgi:hypothetical protein